MKAVLISMQPKWVDLITSGKKMIEVRKSHPKLETPFKVYIYETNWCDNTYWKHQHKGRLGKVIGEFVCDKVENIFSRSRFWLNEDTLKLSCLSAEQIWDYANGAEKIYGWHISELKIYDKLKELIEFIRICPEWEKEKITDKCYSCNHYFKNYEECFAGCDVEGELPIARPPQSWCYVEEV